MLRGQDPEILRRIAANGGGVGCLATQSSPFAILSNCKIGKAFLYVTSAESRYRVTEYAVLPLIEHYVRCMLTKNGILNTENLLLGTTVLYTMGWLHELPGEDPVTPAEYNQINEILNIVAPDMADYRRVLARWTDALKALDAAPGNGNPRRRQYHERCLHYIFSDILGAQDHTTIMQLCDYNQAADIPDMGHYTPAALDDNDWRQVWSDLTLVEKHRYFQLCAVVDLDHLTPKSISMIFVAFIGMPKMGTVTEEWLDTQVMKFTAENNMTLDPAIVTAANIASIYTQFIAKSKPSMVDLHYHLHGRYHDCSRLTRTCVSWVINQAIQTGIAGLMLIADICGKYDIRYEVLAHLGIPEEEFAQFAGAVLSLGQNRLNALVDSPINSGKFSTLLDVCQILSGAGCLGNRRNPKAEQIATQLTAFFIVKQTQA